MVTNPYFTNGTSREKTLYENLIVESIKQYGHDVYYIPRTVVDADPTFYDDVPSRFGSAYLVEAYLDNVDGYSGQGQLFQKFGIENRDEAVFVVTKKRWREAVQSQAAEVTTDDPREGDLIYFPLTASIFEIDYVDDRVPFFQLNNLPVYRMDCSLFEYSDEKLDTGLDSVDAIETVGFQVELVLDSDANDWASTVGDTLRQVLSDGTEVYAEVVAWDSASRTMSLAHLSASDGDFHLFLDSGDVSADSSGLTGTVRSSGEDLAAYSYQNEAFESPSFIVLDENNPLGGP